MKESWSIISSNNNKNNAINLVIQELLGNIVPGKIIAAKIKKIINNVVNIEMN